MAEPSKPTRPSLGAPLAGAGRYRRTELALLAVLAVVIVGWALYATAVVMVPIVTSVFVALLVAPVDRAVAARVPDRLKWLGHVAAMGIILVVLALFFGSIWVASQRVVDRFPSVSREIERAIPGGADGEAARSGGGEEASGGSGPAGTGDAAPATPAQAGNEGAGGEDPAGAGLFDFLSGRDGALAERVQGYASDLASTILNSATTTLGGLVLIFFLTLLMLMEAPRWQAKLVSIIGDGSDRNWSSSLDIIAARLRRYLLARTIIGLATGVLYAGWLWIFGVDLLIVWGLLAFLLNFIPTLGSLIAGILPVAYAFTQEDLQTAIPVAIGILVIEQIMGNFIDPKVQGRQVSLSPLVVLIGLLVWGWLWGIPGAILATPIIIAAAIIFAHIPAMRPVALLLSRERDLAGLDRMSGQD